MEISSTHSALAHSASAVRHTPDAASAQKHEQEKLALQQQQQEIRNLASRDREVRSHEQAHASAGGAHAGSPQYELTRGPNGRSYATGGHVKIDVSEVPGDAQATIDKMQTVQRAALAPAQPSAQDRAVAAAASAKAMQARVELQQEKDGQQARNDQGTQKNQISAYQSVQSAQEVDSDSGNNFEVYA